jgi:hypothetical protein
VMQAADRLKPFRPLSPSPTNSSTWA